MSRRIVTKIRIGDKFGRLTAIGILPRTGPGPRLIRLLCACGKYKTTASCHLVMKTVRSCGCLRRETTRHRLTRHGGAAGKMEPEYRILLGLRNRCRNPKCRDFHRYGGRGITVCERWLGPDGYVHFLEDVGRRPAPGLTIERIKNHVGYEPGNVRWATAKEQARNRRSNRVLEWNGESHLMVEWAEKTGIPMRRIWSRLDRGWSVDRALSVPVG